MRIRAKLVGFALVCGGAAMMLGGGIAGAAATPTVSVSPSSGIPAIGTPVVTVSGSGFSAGKTGIAAVECSSSIIAPAAITPANALQVCALLGLGKAADGSGQVPPFAATLKTGQVGSNPASICPPTAGQVAAGQFCFVALASLDAAEKGFTFIHFAGEPVTTTTTPAPTTTTTACTAEPCPTTTTGAPVTTAHVTTTARRATTTAVTSKVLGVQVSNSASSQLPRTGAGLDNLTGLAAWSMIIGGLLVICARRASVEVR